VAVGITDESGRFRLTCKGRPGCCAGENRVLVMEPELPAHLKVAGAHLERAKYFEALGGRPLPPQYANLVDSPLVVDITADLKEYPFDLTR
jgi:hypothetical protein